MKEDLENGWTSPKILSERNRIDALAHVLANGYQVSVHYEEKLSNLVSCPQPALSAESFLSQWEADKRILNQYFGEFVDAFGIEALFAAAYHKNLYFQDECSKVWLYQIDTVIVHLTEKLISVMLKF